MDVENPFDQDVVAAVARHMNEDHAQDSVLIVRALGGFPDAVEATTTGLDGNAIEFSVQRPGAEPATARIPWSAPLAERAQIRTEVTRMYHEARARLGEAPDGEDRQR